MACTHAEEPRAHQEARFRHNQCLWVSTGELWSSIDSTLYIACYYVGFVASGFYFAQFFLLLCVQNAVRRHHRKHRQWPGLCAPFAFLTMAADMNMLACSSALSCNSPSVAHSSALLHKISWRSSDLYSACVSVEHGSTRMYMLTNRNGCNATSCSLESKPVSMLCTCTQTACRALRHCACIDAVSWISNFAGSD